MVNPNFFRRYFLTTVESNAVCRTLRNFNNKSFSVLGELKREKIYFILINSFKVGKSSFESDLSKKRNYIYFQDIINFLTISYHIIL